MENGCLAHSIVPYGFKACAFLEAYNLGYKTVLWVDSRVKALNDLSEVIKFVKKNGILIQKAYFRLDTHYTEELLEDYGVTERERNDLKHLRSGILGMDFSFKEVRDILFNWHDYGINKKYYHPRFPENLY